MPGLLADMTSDPALAARLRESFDAAREEISAVLERAARRGEIGEDSDLEGFHAALLGIPFVGAHLQGRADEEAAVSALTRQLLAILGAGRD